MKGIFIPNFDMPRSCWVCPCMNEDGWCGANIKLWVKNCKDVRCDGCPLKEIKICSFEMEI